MPASTEDRRAELQRITKCFDDRLRLARASELASLGHLLEAEALLCPGMHIPMSAEELDLLARIHVKQRRYDLARRRWEDAIKTGNQRFEYEDCIKALDKWLDYNQRMAKWRLRLGLWTGAVLLATWWLTRIYFSSHE